jgi:hypothetical protein
MPKYDQIMDTALVKRTLPTSIPAYAACDILCVALFELIWVLANCVKNRLGKIGMARALLHSLDNGTVWSKPIRRM